MDSFKEKKYLITGGTGFIGSALVCRLVKEKCKVRVLDNNLRGVAERLTEVQDQIELVTGDIRDPLVVKRAVKGVDSVFHLAYLNGTEFFYTKPELVLDIGVKGMINVLDACIENGVKELILASSSEVYQTPPIIPTPENVPLVVPDPFNPRYSYGGGKIICELMTLNYGRKFFNRVMIFRPHNVYGPDMGWEHVLPQFILRMKKICSKSKGDSISFPIQGSGKETRAFVYIDDFIDGLLTVLQKGQHLDIYHIGTSEEITIAHAAMQLGSYFGKKVNVVPGELAEGGTLRRCPDIAKLQKLGYQPKINFAEGIHYIAEWYDQNAHKQPETALSLTN